MHSTLLTDNHFSGGSAPQQNGSYWGLNLSSSMALADNWAMCGERNNSGKVESGITLGKTTKNNQPTTRMEFEYDWTKHRKSSAFSAGVIHSATSFMPWSRKIPINEGYHEFL
ncbi:hypothetical protein LOK49_LG03G00107 [Camellia lanceoleosa]|uniref:Uncharacterized protein n=1 Tax=Camellia lanceoleosa TaxID=1840588 RepID=A0ACC0IF04_9ERIC|nr:hypothetical protein LOK49_LG03G00107 [Camellia lanceoleosa]